ncbi:hypothetical protein V5799_010120 [Amblyomma americanum]|uniref:Uncharacterized protein n=1 Tax=Amblyomma americanum TaxID=6943 RepID=A0AAQ4F8J2_AMBAM
MHVFCVSGEAKKFAISRATGGVWCVRVVQSEEAMPGLSISGTPSVMSIPSCGQCRRCWPNSSLMAVVIVYSFSRLSPAHVSVVIQGDHCFYCPPRAWSERQCYNCSVLATKGYAAVTLAVYWPPRVTQQSHLQCAGHQGLRSSHTCSVLATKGYIGVIIAVPIRAVVPAIVEMQQKWCAKHSMKSVD